MQSHPLPVLGKSEGLIESKHRMVVTTFHVVNGDGGSLLSYFSSLSGTYSRKFIQDGGV